jgi:hypothetical protein
MECCHNNGNPRDNRPENLRWSTAQDNWRDRRKHGNAKDGEEHPKAKLRELDVRWIRYLARAGVPQVDLAEVYGVVRNTICDIVHRRSWTRIPDPLLGIGA